MRVNYTEIGFYAIGGYHGDMSAKRNLTFCSSLC